MHIQFVNTGLHFLQTKKKQRKMSLTTKCNKINSNCSQIFLDKLQRLHCPFTEDVDESWVIQLIFHPGEPRIRLLQWLFSKFDSGLDDLLDTRYASTCSKIDSRLQRLLFVASQLQLCGEDEMDLIKGNVSSARQMAFMDQLLELVLTREAIEEGNISSHLISTDTCLENKFLEQQQLIDNLVDSQTIKLSQLSIAKPKMFPADMNMQMEKKLSYRGDRLAAPNTNRIEALAQQISQDLVKHTTMLNELKEKHTLTIHDPQIKQKISKTLQLVLSELSQLVVGLSYCYENEMRAWCVSDPGRQPSMRLADCPLGATMKRVLNLLQQFNVLLQNFESIRNSCDGFHQRQQRLDKLHTGNFFGTGGEEAVEFFKDCSSVLNFPSSEPNVSINSVINTTVTMQ